MYVCNARVHTFQRQDAETTKFCPVTPDTCKSSLCNWIHVTRLGA